MRVTKGGDNAARPPPLHAARRSGVPFPRTTPRLYTCAVNKLLVLAAVLGISLALTVLKRDKQGAFLGVPYNFAWPTPNRIKRGVWDPDNPSLVNPHVYGWGYSVNLHAVARRLGLV